MRSKNYGINVRVTEQEKQKLLENARFCSLSLSEYLRRLGLGKEVRAAITERDYTIKNPSHLSITHRKLVEQHFCDCSQKCN